MFFNKRNILSSPPFFQPMPRQYFPANGEIMQFPTGNTFGQYTIYPYSPHYGNFPHGNENFFHGPVKKQQFTEMLYENPLYPFEKMPLGGGAAPYQAFAPMSHPYPKQAFIHKPPSGVQSIINSFKTQDGSLDLNKVLDTAGLMMNTVNQVSSVIKGLSGIFKV